MVSDKIYYFSLQIKPVSQLKLVCQFLFFASSALMG